MSITFSYEFYEVFEDKFGKESAKKVVDSLENAISIAIDYKWARTKDELLEAIRKEFVTKELFEEKIQTLRVEFRGDIERLKIDLEGKLESLKTSLEGKIDKQKTELEGKLENLKTSLEGKMDKQKTDLEGKMDKQKTDLEGKIENLRTELEGKIELVKMEIQGVNMKLNFLIILMILALTLMNPVMAEIIKHFFGL